MQLTHDNISTYHHNVFIFIEEYHKKVNNLAIQSLVPLFFLVYSYK